MSLDRIWEAELVARPQAACMWEDLPSPREMGIELAGSLSPESFYTQLVDLLVSEHLTEFRLFCEYQVGSEISTLSHEGNRAIAVFRSFEGLVASWKDLESEDRTLGITPLVLGEEFRALTWELRVCTRGLALSS